MAALTTVLPPVVSAQSETDTERADDVATIDVEEAALEVISTELHSQQDNVRWAALRAATELRDPRVAEAARFMCDSPDVLERVLALELIINSDANLGREQFLAALNSPDRAVRLRGLLGLEKIGDPSTTLEIARRLTDDGDPDLQAAAARALGSIGDAAAVPALYSAMGDPHATVRRAAVAALVEIGDPNVGRYLVSRLNSARRSEILPLLRLLTLVREPSLVPELYPYLEHDLPRVRAWAAAAILAALDMPTVPGP
jgi:HEAT repeat protein